MGVGFFGGKFWSCNDASVSKVEECVGEYEGDDGEMAPLCEE